MVLRREAKEQLGYVRRLLDGRKTFSQHRELLVVGGWLSLLLGCLHNDMGNRRAAEAARDAAHHLGKEAGHPTIVRWSAELTSWFALNDDRFHDVTRYAQAGLAGLTKADSASVQLSLQSAKGFAKLGRRREAEAALQRGSALLHQLPSVERPEHHFVFDPAVVGRVHPVLRAELVALVRRRGAAALRVAETLDPIELVFDDAHLGQISGCIKPPQLRSGKLREIEFDLREGAR